MVHQRCCPGREPGGLVLPRRAQAVCVRVRTPPSAASARLLRESAALADRRRPGRCRAPCKTMQERCQGTDPDFWSCWKIGTAWEDLTAAHVGVQAAATRRTMALPVCWLCTKSRAAWRARQWISTIGAPAFVSACHHACLPALTAPKVQTSEASRPGFPLLVCATHAPLVA